MWNLTISYIDIDTYARLKLLLNSCVVYNDLLRCGAYAKIWFACSLRYGDFADILVLINRSHACHFSSCGVSDSHFS